MATTASTAVGNPPVRPSRLTAGATGLNFLINIKRVVGWEVEKRSSKLKQLQRRREKEEVKALRPGGIKPFRRSQTKPYSPRAPLTD